MSATGIPTEVLQCWQQLRNASISRITGGLINETYLVDSGTSLYVLQRLHPVFDARVNNDIQAVTAHLAQQGLVTPLIVPARQGALCCEHDGHIWRLLSYVPGHTTHSINDGKMAFEAGRVAAKFHAALSNFEYNYQSGRGHVHDTVAHLKKLVAALDEHGGHRLYRQVEPLAQRLLADSNQYGEIDDLPLRHCHGDLKISNILFDDENHAICLIDLDTVNRMAWPLEMGDALRSWCNRRAEDQRDASLDLTILDEAVSGYGTKMPSWLSTGEKELLVTGLVRICLELSARFLTDALVENYFGWDKGIYPTRGDHNLARGKTMIALYDDILKKRTAAERIVRHRLISF